MLSILIPVYSNDVTSLVGALVEQTRLLNFTVEIICIDDQSNETWKKRNAPIRDFKEVTYTELLSNIGRSKIRNLLASKAQYPMLLFLDSDSKIIAGDFLSQYTESYTGKDVMVGGRIYPSESPEVLYNLHWKYGSLIEQKATSDFQSNNFLIPASLFRRYPFDESLTRYGHEDTLFGYQLRQAGIQIRHIDNPVLHNKLESNPVFLQNQVDAIKNLIKVKSIYPMVETRLTQVIHQLDKYRMSLPVARLFEFTKTLIIGNLHGKNPSLTLLHFFKIGTYLLERGDVKKEKRPS
jgi:glycosyltransferase involved in cell wall biosynthesis